MSYGGNKVEIPLGRSGVHTDDPLRDLAPGELTRGQNIDFYQGLVQKAPGSKQWNGTQLVYPGTTDPLPIIGGFDWYPSLGVQRPVVACLDGQLYRFRNSFRYQQVTPATASDPVKLTIGDQPVFTWAGRQGLSSPKKLFFFSGGDLPQVIEGDGATRRNITTPATDWAVGNYPSNGIVFRGHLFTFGTPAAPHDIIASISNDHENFVGTGTLTFSIFPGEGIKLMAACVYRGRLFVAKFPTGVYMLDDSDQDSSNWYFKKVTDAAGACSQHSFVEVLEDMYMANQLGTITSMGATFQLGDVKFSDITAALRCEDYIRHETRSDAFVQRWAVYHSDRKLALFSYSSPSASTQSGAGWDRPLTPADRIICLDITQNKPKIYHLDKDNVCCLFLLQNQFGKMVPAYGGTDGYVYTLDSHDSAVGPNGYAADMTILGNTLGVPQSKNFDFLEIEVEHTGLWTLYCDVYLKGRFAETVTFTLANPPVLSAVNTDSKCFQLGKDRLVGRQTHNKRKRLHGRGREIMLRFYTDTSKQTFKLAKVLVWFRAGDDGNKHDDGGETT